MKVPVYLEPSLELIGVVDIDSVQQQMLEQQRYFRLAKYPDMPRHALDIGPIPELTYDIIEFRYFPLKNAYGAKTICLTVRKKEWLSAWDKQLWPRKRKKNHRLTNGERKARREARRAHPSFYMPPTV